ncbi:MAG: ABC transporter substrate-binding protein [Candidatus Limnocylindria bacterium]
MRSVRNLAFFLVAVLLATACGPQGGTQPPEGLGGTVSVLVVWGGAELESFEAMVAPFEERTGTDVQIESTRDLNAVLQTRVQGGNPPDVAGLPGPGQMAEFARAGDLVDLGGVLDLDRMRDEYAADWIELGSVDGTTVGIFIKSSAKGFIWYDPAVWQDKGFEPPSDWDGLIALSERMQADGTAPWCIGLESGDASGWPGTDWLEDIVLRQAGPDVYDRWYQGEIAWTSPEIKSAWETWGEVVAAQGMVLGGGQGMLATSFQSAGDPLFRDPPGCYMHHQASFITDFFIDNNPGLEPVTDFTFFGFPDVDPQHQGGLEVAGDLFGMFNDTPQARELMKWLTTAEAQQIWVERGGALSPNKNVDPAAYPDEISREIGELLTNAEIARFDASDLMPAQMNAAFWEAVLDYVQDPSRLDAILADLDRVQAEAY